MYKEITECLQSKNCSDCQGCPADKVVWDMIEKGFTNGNSPSIDDLELYYRIKAKYELYLDEVLGRTTKIGLAMMPSLLQRYGE